MRGLVIGRFQPFHEGHRYLLGHIASDVDEVVVGVGSAGQSHSAENPFTAGERIAMVQRVLDGMDATTYLVPVPDVDENAMWVRYVETLCPPFEVAYTNNPWVQRLFEEDGYEVRETPLHERDSLRGSAIRERIVAGEPWRDLVPDPVVRGIEAVDGVARLRAITSDDE